jgi:excisionase family DNA binding protein
LSHPYLTPAQVAELWQVDVSTVYRLVDKDPTMPATRIGGSVRFRADRLEAWCEARTQGRERKASRTGQRDRGGYGQPHAVTDRCDSGQLICSQTAGSSRAQAASPARLEGPGELVSLRPACSPATWRVVPHGFHL